MNKADFQNWNLFYEEINSNNSTLHKKDVLLKWKNNSIVKWVLLKTYDPYTQYYVSKKALDKLKFADLTKVIKPAINNSMSLELLLELLSKRNITGHEALHTTKYFIDNCGFGNVVELILDRDAGIRAGTTLINEAMENLIPKFEVQLAEKYDPKRIDFVKNRYFVSTKLDGCRLEIIINETGAINFFSRSGKPFYTLDKIRQELEPLGLKNVVLDGEVCSMDENGIEDFQGVMSEITRKDYTMKNPKFLCFDMISLKEFNDRVGEPDRTYFFRYKQMEQFFELHTFKHLELLEHIEVKSFEEINAFAIKMQEAKREGYMVNADVPYIGKRSFFLMKGKTMEDCECKVLETVNGPISVIIYDEDGNSTTRDEEMLSAIIIEYKGERVRCGSGFSLAQRRRYYLHPEEIIDQICTIQFFEETKDKNGKISLRFPVFKFNHGKQRTT